MAFSAKRSNGIEVSCGNTKIVLDPSRTSKDPVFISHAHGDHCRGLKLAREAYSTRATFKLAQVREDVAGEGEKTKNIIEYRDQIAFDDIEVVAHNAGHILGSAQYEIVSPTGNAVYTGDINFRDTLLTKKAEAVPCDLLIIESTYGTPSYFPSRKYMYERIVEWTAFSIKTGKIPAFQTDALGNAQELIALLNELTDFPVLTHPKVSRYNRVYHEFDHKLAYIDANSVEGKEVMRGKECAFVLPKNINLSCNPELNAAYVSGWGSKFSGRRKAFSLSDHSDFYGLLEYVETAKPKMVLTCHGSIRSKMALSKKIRRMLNIPSSALTREEHTLATGTGYKCAGQIKECAKTSSPLTLTPFLE